MTTLTIELTDNKSLKALQDLESKNLIRIVTEPDTDSYSLPGKPISVEDFKKWIEFAENSPTVSLTEAKLRWSEQKKASKQYSLRITEHALQNIANITGYIAYIRHEPLNVINVGDEIFKTIYRI